MAVFGKSIKSEVMKVVEQRINATQANYEKECKMIDEQAAKAKETAFASAVNSIVGRFFGGVASAPAQQLNKQD